MGKHRQLFQNPPAGWPNVLCVCTWNQCLSLLNHVSFLCLYRCWLLTNIFYFKLHLSICPWRTYTFLTYPSTLHAWLSLAPKIPISFKCLQADWWVWRKTWNHVDSFSIHNDQSPKGTLPCQFIIECFPEVCSLWFSSLSVSPLVSEHSHVFILLHGLVRKIWNVTLHSLLRKKNASGNAFIFLPPSL